MLFGEARDISFPFELWEIIPFCRQVWNRHDATRAHFVPVAGVREERGADDWVVGLLDQVFFELK